MSKVPANFIGLSTTIGIQQPIGTYGGQIYLQKWCQPMVFPDVLYWPINYYHRYLKTYRHLCCLQKWCQPMVEIVFPEEEWKKVESNRHLGYTTKDSERTKWRHRAKETRKRKSHRRVGETVARAFDYGAVHLVTATYG